MVVYKPLEVVKRFLIDKNTENIINGDTLRVSPTLIYY